MFIGILWHGWLMLILYLYRVSQYKLTYKPSLLSTVLWIKCCTCNYALDVSKINKWDKSICDNIPPPILNYAENRLLETCRTNLYSIHEIKIDAPTCFWCEVNSQRCNTVSSVISVHLCHQQIIILHPQWKLLHVWTKPNTKYQIGWAQMEI